MGSPPANAYAPGTVLTVGSHKAMINKYLSQGGFAHVYTVSIDPPFENGSSKEQIACLKRVLVPNKATLNILRAEVDAMKRLRGKPYIVKYIDSHAARSPANDGTYEVFLLMEYCSNNGLIDFLNTRLQNRLSESEVLEIMYQTCIAVSQVHFLNPPLIHRDIKIENILITKDHQYRLCDFGSSCPPLRPPRNTQELQIIQNDILRYTTPQYRSPEMIDFSRGIPVDEKSDIWALGVFCYKICYYTTPFERSGDRGILKSEYSLPSFPVYSPRLQHLIRVLLTNDARQRPDIYMVLEEICKMKGAPMSHEIHDQYVLYKQQKHQEKLLQQQQFLSNQLTANVPSNVPKPQMETQTPLSKSTNSLSSMVTSSMTGASMVMPVAGAPLTSSNYKKTFYDDKLAKSNVSLKSGKSEHSFISGNSLKSVATSSSSKSNISNINKNSKDPFANLIPFKSDNSLPPSLNEIAAASHDSSKSNVFSNGSLLSSAVTFPKTDIKTTFLNDNGLVEEPKSKPKPVPVPSKVHNTASSTSNMSAGAKSVASTTGLLSNLPTKSKNGTTTPKFVVSEEKKIVLSPLVSSREKAAPINPPRPSASPLKKPYIDADLSFEVIDVDMNGLSLENSNKNVQSLNHSKNEEIKYVSESRKASSASHSNSKLNLQNMTGSSMHGYRSSSKSGLNKLTHSFTGKFRSASNSSAASLTSTNNKQISRNNTGKLSISSSIFGDTLVKRMSSTDIDGSEDELISDLAMNEFKDVDYVKKPLSSSLSIKLPNVASSVQRRMNMLLSSKAQDKITKTATGYGKYTDDAELSEYNGSPDLHRANTFSNPPTPIITSKRNSLDLKRSFSTKGSKFLHSIPGVHSNNNYISASTTTGGSSKGLKLFSYRDNIASQKIITEEDAPSVRTKLQLPKPKVPKPVPQKTSSKISGLEASSTATAKKVPPPVPKKPAHLTSPKHKTKHEQ